MKCPICETDMSLNAHKPECPYKDLDTDKMNLLLVFSRGWECPRCHRIYGPLTQECSHCNKGITNGR